MNYFWPRGSNKFLLKLFIVFLSELVFSFALVWLGKLILNQEIIDTKFLVVRIGIYSSKNSAIFIKLACLESNNFAFEHSSEDLLYVHSILFDLASTAFRGVDSINSEAEPSQFIS